MAKYCEKQHFKTVGFPPNLNFVQKNSYATVKPIFCRRFEAAIPNRLA